MIPAPSVVYRWAVMIRDHEAVPEWSPHIKEKKQPQLSGKGKRSSEVSTFSQNARQQCGVAHKLVT